jgi:hypothetical protein
MFVRKLIGLIECSTLVRQMACGERRVDLIPPPAGQCASATQDRSRRHE